MLKTIRLNDNCSTTGCALVLGGFDGLHLGHSRLIARAKSQGVPVGIMTIVGVKGNVLFTLEERLEFFRAAGVDFVVPFEFADICEKSAEEFLGELEENFAPVAYVCGTDFRFGKGAAGDADSVAKMSKVPVLKEELVLFGGEKVATRKLKDLLAEGKVDEMALMLGTPFFVTGVVVEGRKIGRIIGFPTANIDYAAGKLPLKEGVYIVSAEAKGKTYKGIANFGTQPTFGKMQVRLEVHLDGFEGNLYGDTLRVEFYSYLRPIKKFGDMEELRTQLNEDIQKVRE